ncbi:MAG TPA: 2Fe-2S iron-sulfur cluster-binding protein [Gammaproteobacteria bacterium]
MYTDAYLFSYPESFCMAQLLPLSRAARLVGISRGELQSRIRRNELETFEGMVRVSDLLRAFPETSLVDDSAIERTERIKANASPRTETSGKLPSAKVLARRVTELSRDLTEAKDEAHHYSTILAELEERLGQLRSTETPLSASDIEQLYQWVHEKIEDKPRIPRRKNELMAKDTFLRMVEAQVKLIPSGDEYFVEGTDSLLESALRSGIALRYGCTRGSCSKCKARIVSGEVLKVRDHEYQITDNEHNLGYILMCSYTAVTDLVIEADVARESSDIPLQQIRATVTACERPSDRIAILRLKTPGNFSLRFLAGQAIKLSLPDGESEILPVASCPCDGDQLEFHLSSRHDGSVSKHVLQNGLEPGTSIIVNGPAGDFVLNAESNRPLLLVAVNEGFAPIKSLTESATSIDKAEHFNLYWLADDPKMHYLDNLCRSWADSLDNFDYTPLNFDRSMENEEIAAMFQDKVKSLADIREHDIYLSVPEALQPEIVNSLISTGVGKDQIKCFALDDISILDTSAEKNN